MGEVDQAFHILDLVTICSIASSELVEFSEFHEEIEAFWKRKDEALQEELAKKLEAVAEHEQDEFVATCYGYDLHQNQYKFPAVHRASLVVTLYNFLEVTVNELCEQLQVYTETPLKLKEVHGTGIKRAKIYLSKVIGLDLSIPSEVMEHISWGQELRNRLVHNGAALPKKEDDKLNRYVEKTESLSGAPGGQVGVTLNYVDDLISHMMGFFDALNNGVQKLIEK